METTVFVPSSRGDVRLSPCAEASVIAATARVLRPEFSPEQHGIGTAEGRDWRVGEAAALRAYG